VGQFIIRGCKELKGTVKISGAKNAVLPILAASVMANDMVTLRNVPSVSDVQVMVDILREIGVDVTCEGSTIVIVPSEKVDIVVSDTAARMRFSIVLLGAILAKMGEIHIPLPGGDALGDRRIDQHILALEQFGAEVTVGETHLHAKARDLQGCFHAMTFPSVSGTENSILVACAAEGTSTISGVALEPEVQSFMHFLCAIGGHIDGIGTDTVTICGQPDWGGAEFMIIPDRLEAMTYAMFVGAVG
jgi:UDP-N-acetylglucosamine 1-carboxyvinyltransferase